MDRPVTGAAGAVPPAHRPGASEGRTCPGCAEPAQDGDLFCEGCGTPLTGNGPVPAPGDTDSDDVRRTPAPAPPAPAGAGSPGPGASGSAEPAGPVEAVGEAGAPGPVEASGSAEPAGPVEPDGAAGVPGSVEPVEPAGGTGPVPADEPDGGTGRAVETGAGAPEVPAQERGPVAQAGPGNGGPAPADRPAPAPSGGPVPTLPEGMPSVSPVPTPLWQDVSLEGPPGICRECEGEISSEGSCQLCGTSASSPRDHWEERPAAWVAGVSDRGLRHRRNEDAMAVAATEEAGRWGVLVVSDGVSSAAGSNVASLAAARAAREVLALPLPDEMEARAGQPLEAGGQTEKEEDDILLERMAQAGRAAQRAAAGAAETVGTPDGVNPPSCTLVAALVRLRTLVIGWIGDSRIYWVPDADEPVQLSADDSWIWEQVALGASLEEAERSPWAHAITRWLGRDSPDPVLRTALVELPGPGWVLVCSDGLWNYASHPQRIAEVLRETEASAGRDPQLIAARMVAWAVESGGHDNITVTLARA